jgi:NADH:ubiquinone oxidoreductase subunit 6 (subunit J)
MVPEPMGSAEVLVLALVVWTVDGGTIVPEPMGSAEVLVVVGAVLRVVTMVIVSFPTDGAKCYCRK